MSSDPDIPVKSPRPALEGLDPRRLLAEGLGLDPSSAAEGDAPEVPGYDLLRLLGRGGMGRVYLARQISLDRFVAVKVLPAGETFASQWLDRLEREAHAMARISHPNIVAVYDFVRLDDGGAAIVMEWLESGSLREKWMKRGRPVRDFGTVIGIVRQIASSLVAAHRVGIVHRDLKPENVLVSLDGTVKVSDFGLALPIGQDSERLILTGTSVGTLGYMAPEQLEGKEVDERADLYSLGVVLYELLTGTRPQGNFDPPGRVRRNLPSGLEKLTLDALRTRPQKRVASAAEFLTRLDRCGRTRGRLVLALSLALVAILAGGFAISRFVREDAPVESVPPAPVSPAETPKAETPSPPIVANRDPALSVPPAWAPRVSVKPLRGEWENGADGFQSDSEKAILQLLTGPPPNGARVRIAFTRLEGTHSIALFFRTPRGVGTVEISAWDAHLAGVQCLDGLDLRNLPETPTFVVENGRRYEMLVELGSERIRLSIDGKLIQDVATGGRELSVSYPWEWETVDTRSTLLAIGSYESSTLFHAVEVTESEE